MLLHICKVPVIATDFKKIIMQQQILIKLPASDSIPVGSCSVVSCTHINEQTEQFQKALGRDANVPK